MKVVEIIKYNANLTGLAKEFYWTPKEIADAFGKKFEQGNLVVAGRRWEPVNHPTIGVTSYD